MLFLITLSVILASVHAKYQIEDCGSEWATVDSIDIRGCTTTPDKACVLRKRTEVSFTMDFTPTTDVADLRTVVIGFTEGLTIPIIYEPDSCEYVNSCALRSGERATYRITLPVLNMYPSVKGKLRVELKSGDGKTLICLMIPGRVRN